MRTLTKSMVYVAIAATTILSCTKEIEGPAETTKVGTHVEFSALISDAATKATLTTTDDKDFAAAWEGTDQVSLWAYDGNFDETKPATWKATKGAFEADFVTEAPTTPGSWMYEAKYPYTVDGNIPFGSARVQKGNAYNSAYDIMYGTADYENALLGKDENGDAFEVTMDRLTGIAYFHITSGLDEDVVSATLEATGIAAENVTIASDGKSVAASTGSATLDAITITFAEGTAPKATNLKLWFNVLPGDYTGLKLTVNTSTKKAVLNSNKTMSYTAGKLNKVVLSGLTWKAADPFEGEWILSGIKEAQAYACGKYTEGNNIQNVKAITIDAANQSIEGEDLDDCKITITKVKSGTYKGYYTIQDSNESDNYWYAAGTSNNNHLKAGALAEDDKYFWSISENEGAHIITAKSTNRNTIKFNTNGTSTIFSCYASDGNQASVTLYPYSWVSSISRTAVTLSFNPATPDEITFGDDFTEPTLIKNPSDAPVMYSVETNPEGIASIDASTGGLTITGAGTITVTASVSDEVHYKPASAYYTLSVKELISDYSTAGTSNVTLSTTGGTNASKATVNSYDALKAGTKDNAGAVTIKVPANTTNLHLHAAGWNGEQVTLAITGASANPNSIILTADSGISGSSTSYTLSEESDIADYYFNINLSGINEETTLTFTATNGKRFVIWGVNAAEDKRLDSGMSWSATSASATIGNSGVTFTAPILTFGNASGITYASTDPAVASVDASTGSVTILAGGTTKIQAIFAGDATYRPTTAEYTLTVTDDRTYAITVSQPAEGGSISASPNGSQKAGTTINLSADAVDGFKFGEWKVYKTGDESTKVTVTGSTFEMPAYSVTVTAAFVVDDITHSEQTLFLETFGDNGGNNTAVDSYSGYTATQTMFSDPSSSVVSHYSSVGKVGKNSVNPSQGYDNVSGKSAVWTQATKNTTTNLFTVDKIDISNATDITVSFGLFYLNGVIGSSSTVKAYYTIDNNSEVELSFTQPSATNSWTLCSGTISGTGSVLKIRFELTVTGGYTVRIDDIRVAGTK